MRVLGGWAEEIGLTEERVRTMAENRLRAARLYTDDLVYPDEPTHVSHVGVYIETLEDGPAFTQTLEFNKVVTEPLSGLTLFAETWERRILGTTSNDAALILLQVLSEGLDSFVLEYLRVNEEAC